MEPRRFPAKYAFCLALGVDLRSYGNAPLPRNTDNLSVQDDWWLMPYLPRAGM